MLVEFSFSVIIEVEDESDIDNEITANYYDDGGDNDNNDEDFDGDIDSNYSDLFQFFKFRNSLFVLLFRA